jgi:hypothetical protein
LECHCRHDPVKPPSSVSVIHPQYAKFQLLWQVLMRLQKSESRQDEPLLLLQLMIQGSGTFHRHTPHTEHNGDIDKMMPIQLMK